MTKKHFIFVAGAMRALRPVKSKEAVKYAQWVRTVAMLDTQLAETNRMFDTTRFLAACYA